MQMSQTHKLKGIFTTQTVWLDGKILSPERSLKVYNHSPTGFSWGYLGSGPAQLALAIMLELTDQPHHYQDFKSIFIANLPQSDFEVTFKLSDILVPFQTL